MLFKSWDELGLRRRLIVTSVVSLNFLTKSQDYLIRHWINENKTGKDNVCKGKLSFQGDIVSKLSCLQFFHGRKSTFLELILHSLR
jgi:hypothetical protein